MAQKMFARLLCVLSLVVLPVAGHCDEWEFIIAPYGLLPNITGDTSLGRIDDASLDLSAKDVFEVLEFGAMLQLEAHHSSGFGVLLNYGFMNLGDSLESPREFTRFEADIFQATLEGYGTYRAKFDTSVLDFYAGVRWWDIDLDLEVDGPLGSRSYSRDEDWVDPVVGLRWIPKLSEDWHLILQGDVGGFGVASEFSWNIQAGAAWVATESVSLVLMYRALSVDYDTGTRDTADFFEYDTITQGPLLGVVFRL